MVALTFSLLASTEANAAQCYTMPSCEAMGYTRSSCSSHESAIKCPFNTSLMKCVPGCDQTLYTLDSCDSSLGTCAQCGNKYKYVTCKASASYNEQTGACEKLRVGMVYEVAGAPIGIVVSVRNGVLTLVALHNIDHNGYDVPGQTYNTTGSENNKCTCYTGISGGNTDAAYNALSWYTRSLLACAHMTDGIVDTGPAITNNPLGDMNGPANTDLLTSPQNRAATLVRKYAPGVCQNYSGTVGAACKKGKWYIPSAGEMYDVLNDLESVNAGLRRFGGTPFDHYDSHWTSTACNDSQGKKHYIAWMMREDHYADYFCDNSEYYNIRPFLRIE